LIIKNAIKYMSSNFYTCLIGHFINLVIHRSHLNTGQCRHGTHNRIQMGILTLQNLQNI
jgi:hypothetical protein